MKRTGILFIFCLLLLAGCKKDIQTKESVRQAVIQHLSGKSGLDVSSMDVEVSSVTFRDTEADATVAFAPKGSKDPASNMSMKYTLERKGNQWVVKNKAGAGAGNPHGAGGGMPGASEGGLPSGHPPLGGAPSPHGESPKPPGTNQ